MSWTFKSSVSWNVTPSSPVKSNRRFVGATETPVDFHRTRRRYIPEDVIVYNYRYEDLKTNIR
jgi:hypothetical protein